MRRSHATRAAWVFGVLLIGAVLATALHFSEMEHFGDLVRQSDPSWLIAAAAAQFGTYACSAASWWITLTRAGVMVRFPSLLPLSLVKLFTDQAVPTGGLSGAMVVVAGLRRRGIGTSIAMETMLVTLVAYYSAYAIAVATSIALLWLHNDVTPLLLGGSLALIGVAVGIPVGIFWLRRRDGTVPKVLDRRFPELSEILDAGLHAPADLLSRRGFMATTVALQFAVFLLDIATLWFVFLALGQPQPVWVAYATLVTAMVAATLGPVPLGLGTFEATAVGMLVLLDCPIETAIAATILQRGLTFWLPMLPGVFLSRREFLPRQAIDERSADQDPSGDPPLLPRAK